MAELFPAGLQRRSLEEFKRLGHRGGVGFTLPIGETWLRVGMRDGDFLVGASWSSPAPIRG